MDIPWETLVKAYRRHLGHRRFAHLVEYADDFCAYLTNEAVAWAPPEHQDELLLRLIARAFQRINDEIRNHQLNSVLRAGAQARGDAPAPGREAIMGRLADAAREVVDEWHARAKDAGQIDHIPPDFGKTVRLRLQRRITDLRRAIIEAPQDSAIARKLNQIAVRIGETSLEQVSGGALTADTGLAIAGFGEAEVFPGLVAIEIEGMFDGVLRGKRGLVRQLDPHMPASIIPFAQHEMVDTFMEGIDPRYLKWIEDGIWNQLDDYADAVVSALDRYTPEEKELLMRQLQAFHAPLVASFNEKLNLFRSNTFAEPIVRVVTNLPAGELGAMAETLVNLTSFKRHISPEEETVGGPIDVAVLTKGDGLVWTKRKHYFSAELNPAYFARTYGGATGHGEHGA